jgi:antitoxin component YwqK of YwqJK toxin-antitoxin module
MKRTMLIWLFIFFGLTIFGQTKTFTGTIMAVYCVDDCYLTLKVEADQPQGRDFILEFTGMVPKISPEIKDFCQASPNPDYPELNPKYKGKKATITCITRGTDFVVQKIELDSGVVAAPDSVKMDARGNEITVIRYPNGNVKSEEAKKDGKLNGVSKYYGADGKLQQELTYENGFLTRRLTYWAGGSKKDDESFKMSSDKYPHSIGTGVSNHWYESGQLRLTQTFNADGKIIQHKEYYPSGKIKSESSMDATLAGTQTSYYESGKKKEVITYGTGSKPTKMVQYDETGMITKTVNY